MNSQTKQNGMVLLVSLVLLLILTIVAISAVTLSTSQERMAANSQQQNVAFQAAESGLQYWIDLYQSSSVSASTTRTLADAGTNTIPRYRVSAAAKVCTDVPTSLNAGENSGTPQLICYDISSQAKACAEESCDIAADDGQARALHMQGYRARINL